MTFTLSKRLIFLTLLTATSTVFANDLFELVENRSELPAIPMQMAENNLNLVEPKSSEKTNHQEIIQTEVKGDNNKQKMQEEKDRILSQTFTFKELYWQDLRLQGSKTDLTFYLPQPKQIKYKNASLNLELTQSSLLKENSSLTFLFNNNHLLSSLALKAGNTAPLFWDINLPSADLNNNWLSLGLIARWSAELCKDYDDPANWVYISPNSKLNLQYQKLNFLPEFSNLPYPFNYNNFLDGNSLNLFVLASPLTPATLEPALIVARKMGIDARNNLPQFKAVLANELTESQNLNSNQIYVGIAKDIPFIQDKLLPLIQNEAESRSATINSTTGILSLMPSLANPFHALLTVTGENEEALSKAALAFSQPNFTKLFSGDLALIQEKPAIFQQEKQQEGAFSLKSLGLSDQTTLSLGQSTLSYSFNLPADRVVDKVDINTVLSHSAFKAGNHSNLTLSVNGVRQGSIILNNENGENAVWPLTIPGEMLKPGANSLDYIFDLHIPSEGCATHYDYQSWGLIQAQTTIEPFFSEDLPLVDLNRFPLLFDENTLIVLPQTMKSIEATAIINFFTQLGALFGYDSAELKPIASDKLNVEMLKNHNLILIGTTQNNSLIEQSLRKAPLSLDKGKLILHEENNIQALDKNALGFIELMNSSWNPNLHTLVISGTSEEDYAKILNQFSSPLQFAQFKGNVAILMQDGSLASFETRPKPLIPVLSAKRPVSLLTNLRNEAYRKELMHKFYANLGLIVIVFFSIIAIFLAIVGFFQRRKKSKS